MTESPTQFESDELLRLLTDALRAGPGSAQWQEAVSRLRQANPPEADDYRLILEARENLEAGREYRSIRPGPNFTRKVMQAVEEEAEGKKAAVPSANLIALGAALVILAVVIVIAIALFNGHKENAQNDSVEGLKQLAFTHLAAGGDFTGDIPPEFRVFGLHPAVSDKGLRGGANKEGTFRGGGVCLANPMPADQPFAVEATIQVSRPTQNIDVRLFVSEDDKFDKPEAVSAREFAVDLHDSSLNIFKPDLNLVGESPELHKKEQMLKLLIKIDRQFAVVELDGKVLYAGSHGLWTDGPRYPGLRFLTRSNQSAAVSVPVLRIVKP